MNDERKPFLDHLEELRRRMLVCLVSVALGSALAYPGVETFLGWLSKPVGGLVFFAPAEAFLVRLKIAFFGGAFLAAPIVLYEIWGFAARGLARGEKRILIGIIPASYLLFILGTSLALFFVAPAAVRFLIACGSESLRPLMGVGPYLEFVAFLCFAFGLLFQLPLALFVLNRLGFVTPFQLASRRRLIYLGSFVAAALLTPGPDVFSQMLLALPTLVLFEISLIVMRWSSPPRGAATARSFREMSLP